MCICVYVGVCVCMCGYVCVRVSFHGYHSAPLFLDPLRKVRDARSTPHTAIRVRVHVACVYVCTCVCMCVRVSFHVYRSAPAFVDPETYVAHTAPSTSRYVPVSTYHVCTCARVCVCVCVCACLFMGTIPPQRFLIRYETYVMPEAPFTPSYVSVST